MSFRTMFKHGIEKTLVDSGFARRRILRHGAETVAVLAYHNIVPRGERAAGDGSLHLPQDAFADQLDALLETHEVKGLDCLFDAPEPGGRPVAIITFDDAYLGAMTAGIEEVRKRGLSVAVFVNPGALEWEGFWWDRLADTDSGLLSPSIREHGLSALGGRQVEILRWAEVEGLPQSDVPPHSRPASLATLQSLDDDSAVSFGSHSWEHARLPALDPDALFDDLARTRMWLGENLAHTTPWLSYPYGHASAAGRAVAGRVEKGALLVEGGAAHRPVPTHDRTAVPRINIPSGVSREGFVLRL